LLALSRQALPALRQDASTNHTARGAYIMREATGPLAVTLFASGSEVAIAVDARQQLEEAGYGTRVISVPCMELFAAQPMDYQVSLLCNKSLKVAVEAGVAQGWERFIGPHGLFIGMEQFGASGPAERLYAHFGITATQIVAQATALLGGPSAGACPTRP
jgi:transketolase